MLFILISFCSLVFISSELNLLKALSKISLDFIVFLRDTLFSLGTTIFFLSSFMCENGSLSKIDTELYGIATFP